ncbi:MAG: hypothetical protein K6T65_12810 [Peptococcaceae bacterium]|nr:hypothetical protein [Peptococcaceae bacterium]
MNTKNQAKSAYKAVLWGIISLIMYMMVFLNQQAVTDFFTRGGVYAFPVICTALIFSFVHGAFANYFIDAIGFKPVSKGGH